MNHRPKLLCVDDEEGILQSLERVLNARFQVFTANRPARGLEILKEHPDTTVVLSDFRMPEMTGLQFLHEVKAQYPLISRAIISGQIDLNQVSAAINDGEIHKFFMKPWENDYLLLQVTEALQMHQALKEKAHYQHLSVTDPITQLTNHRYFQDQLRARLSEATTENLPLSLIIFDVDNFKAFNDRFGHPEGDRLLYSVAHKLLSSVGTRGLVSRYGGEEFTLLLPRTEIAAAHELGEEVRLQLERMPFTGLTSSTAYVTISGGVAAFPQNGRTASELIECADRALYQAKRQGRNQIVSGRS